MGQSNTKTQNAGAVINEIDIQPATVENLDIKICLYIITTILTINFVYNLYKLLHKNLKKKYIAKEVI